MTTNRVSPFSSTMIGIHEEVVNPAREIFVAEAQQVSGYLKGIHHSRKISHLQVNYPETVEKLSKLQDMRAQTAHYSTKSILPRSASQEIVYQRKQFRLKDFEQTMNGHVKQEKFINFRKKEFNRETGRKAVANQVISGTAPMPNPVLFPQGATHEQILAIMGSLKAPDANKIPPEVPRQRKWKGDNVGWGA